MVQNATHGASPSRPGAHGPMWGLAPLALTALPAVAALPAMSGGGVSAEPDALLPLAAHLATWAVPAGILAGTLACALGSRTAALGAMAAPLALLALAAFLDVGASNPWRGVPAPFGALVALGGLYLVGAALAPGRSQGATPPAWRSAPEHARRERASIAPAPSSTTPVLPRWGAAASRAGAALLVALVLDGAALGWGRLQPTPAWSPEVTARLLNVSPRAFVLESGGVDWMRHATIYESAGTDRIGPGIRSGWQGSVAASLVLVVGCLAFGARLVRSVPASRPPEGEPRE